MTALRNLLSLKPGLRTTEFWAHAIVSGISLLVAIGLVPVGLPQVDQTWVQLGAFLAAAITTGLYALSRGKVKAGASSLVTMLDHAVTALLSGNNPTEGHKLLRQILPELDGIVPGSGELAKLKALVESHDSVIADVKRVLTFSPAVASAILTSSSITPVIVADPLSSTSEPADGTDDSGPGGFPAEAAAAPVVAVPEAVVSMPAPVATTPAV